MSTAIILGAIMSLVGTGISWGISNHQQDKQLQNAWQLQHDNQRFQSIEADEARQWQEDFYNQHYSLAGRLADARKAGINMNPYVAATNQTMSPAPATSVPAGGVASASGGNPVDGLGDILNFAKSIQDIKESKAREDNYRSDSSKIEELINGIKLDNSLKEIELKFAEAQKELEIDESRTRILGNLSDIMKSMSDITVNNSIIELNGSRIELNYAQSSLFSAEEQLANARTTVENLNADKLRKLLPYVQGREEAEISGLYQSQIESSERSALARRNADIAFLQAIKDEGLLDAGIVDKLIESYDSQSSLNRENIDYLKTKGHNETRMTNANVASIYIDNTCKIINTAVGTSTQIQQNFRDNSTFGIKLLMSMFGK